jgi:hypothetical protein
MISNPAGSNSSASMSMASAFAASGPNSIIGAPMLTPLPLSFSPFHAVRIYWVNVSRRHCVSLFMDQEKFKPAGTLTSLKYIKA